MLLIQGTRGSTTQRVIMMIISCQLRLKKKKIRTTFSLLLIISCKFNSILNMYWYYASHLLPLYLLFIFCHCKLLIPSLLLSLSSLFPALLLILSIYRFFLPLQQLPGFNQAFKYTLFSCPFSTTPLHSDI